MKLKVNGVSYYIIDTGFKNHAAKHAPTLLLLHGFTGSVETWDSFIPAWSRTHRIIAIDCLGHGQSDAPSDPARYAMPEATTDIVDILEHLEVKTVTVLGYSMGGRLALSVALRLVQTSRLTALILESASPGLATLEERRARIALDTALAHKIEHEGLEAFVNYWETLPLFAGIRQLPNEVQLALRRQRLNNREHGLANSLRGMGTGAQPSLWEELTRLHCPVLLIAGENDVKFLDIAKSMVTLLPQATLRVVEQAGHTIHVELPEYFDTIVRDNILP